MKSAGMRDTILVGADDVPADKESFRKVERSGKPRQTSGIGTELAPFVGRYRAAVQSDRFRQLRDANTPQPARHPQAARIERVAG
jgi:hypothetical protein